MDSIDFYAVLMGSVSTILIIIVLLRERLMQRRTFRKKLKIFKTRIKGFFTKIIHKLLRK